MTEPKAADTLGNLIFLMRNYLTSLNARISASDQSQDIVDEGKVF